MARESTKHITMFITGMFLKLLRAGPKGLAELQQLFPGSGGFIATARHMDRLCKAGYATVPKYTKAQNQRFVELSIVLREALAGKRPMSDLEAYSDCKPSVYIITAKGRAHLKKLEGKAR